MVRITDRLSMILAADCVIRITDRSEMILDVDREQCG